MKQPFDEQIIVKAILAIRTRIPPFFLIFVLFWSGCYVLNFQAVAMLKCAKLPHADSSKIIKVSVISDPTAGLHGLSSFVRYRQKKYVCSWPYALFENSVGKLGEECFVSGNFSNLGSSKFEQGLLSQGITGKISVEKIHKKMWSSNLFGQLMRYRNGLINKILAQSKAMEGSLISALIFGYRTRLSTLQNLFKMIGLSHMLSVSGSHFAVAIGFLLFALRSFDIRRSLLVLISVLFSFCFYYLTGMNVATFRACLMASGAQLMFFSNRRIDLLSLVSIAGIIMLMFDPSSSWSLSFQLSFAAIIGIALFYGRFSQFGREKYPFIPEWLTKGMSLGISAQLLTIPIVLIVFHTIAPLSMVSTIAVAMLFEAIIACGIAFVFIEPFSASLSTVVMAIAKIIANLIVTFSLALSAIPGMYYQLSKNVAYIWAIVLTIAAIIVFCATIHLNNPKKYVGWEGKLKVKRARIFASIVIVGCFVIWLIYSSGTIRPLLFNDKNSCGVYFLNVGQGDATLIKDHGENILIDAGPDELALKKELQKVGATHIDMVIFTHGHEDHVRGADLFSASTGIKRIIVARGCQHDKGIQNIARLTHARIVQVIRGDELRLPSSRIRVLSPNAIVQDSDDNASCLILGFDKNPQCASCLDAVITGDAEADTLSGIIGSENLKEIKILKLGHHGSKNSINQQVIDNVDISKVVISVGENSYGHPNINVLELLKKYRIPCERTDVSGTIFYRSMAQ